jgi:hypothetical protein
MSIWDRLNRLLTLHTAAGRLSEINDAVTYFQNARNFNPRSSEDWDILEQRDERMVRINRALQRMRDTTAGLSREGTAVPNESAELSRLFRAWCDAHARHGADARQTQAADNAFAGHLMTWLGDLTRIETQARERERRMERLRAFYSAMVDLFSTLQRLAEQYVRYWPNSAVQAQALAFTLDFERAANLSRAILRNIEAGQSQIGRARSDVRRATDEALVWSRWYGNRRQVERDVPARRAPD